MKLNKCKTCGNDIPVPYRINGKYKVSPANYQKRMFCNNICKAEWMSQHLKGSNNPNHRGGCSVCIDCGIQLPHRYSTRKKTRCRPCWYKFHHGSNHSSYKGNNICRDCGVKTSFGYTRCRKCYGLANRGTNNVAYRENLSYKYLHTWVKDNLGHPPKCEHCGVEGKKHKGNWSIHWANKSGKYLRDLNDWVGLCPLCHVKFDKKN